MKQTQQSQPKLLFYEFNFAVTETSIKVVLRRSKR